MARKNKNVAGKQNGNTVHQQLAEKQPDPGPEPEATVCKINKNNDIVGDEDQHLPADENKINEDFANNIDDHDQPEIGDNIGDLDANNDDDITDEEEEDEQHLNEIGEHIRDANNLDDVTDDEEEDVHRPNGNIGMKGILLLILDLIITKATAFRHRLQQRPPNQPWLPRVAWRQRFDALVNNSRRIWRQNAKAFIKWTFWILFAVFLARLACMIFGIQDKVQSFEEFVKQKNKAYDKVMDTQSYYVEDLLGAQADLKDNIEAVVKASSNNSEHHTGEIAKIKHSIVEVKDEFQRFMVESQMYIVELQEKNNEMQEGMADMQLKMTSEMGGIRKEVYDARQKFDEMKHSLHSIEYSIKNLKDCGFFSRLFGLC